MSGDKKVECSIVLTMTCNYCIYVQIETVSKVFTMVIFIFHEYQVTCLKILSEKSHQDALRKKHLLKVINNSKSSMKWM